MKIRDILEHFLSRADWADRSDTVDRVIVGDADKDVNACAVAWTPDLATCRVVDRAGLDLLICHEPTFWDHRDERPDQRPDCLAKLRFLQDCGLTVVRIHDCWDRWPAIGIPWAWADFLHLPGPPVQTVRERAQHRYDIDPIAFERFAARVAKQTERVGEPLVEVTGDPERIVSRIGIGTGCIAQVEAFLKMGCDCCIVTDDGTSYWRDVQHASDRDIPVICVNHATSEEPGMVTLTRYINNTLDGLTARHIVQGCRFGLVGANGPVVTPEGPDEI